MTTISIPYNDYFSFQECHRYLDRNQNDCLYSIGEKSIRKALKIRGKSIIADISEMDHSLRVKIIAGSITPEMEKEVRSYVIDWFDPERDISPFYQLLKKQDRLAYMVSDFSGLRLLGIPNLFEALCWCIIGQQINLAFAHKVKRSLVEKYGEKIDFENNTFYLFPSYNVIARLNIDELRSMQFSIQKARYMITVAQAFSSGEISRENIVALPDLPARQELLLSLKGVGIWTANYVLMKCLRELTCIPYGDAGLLNALTRHSIIEKKSDSKTIDKFFAHFPGWESYMVFYLWRSLSRPGKN